MNNSFTLCKFSPLRTPKDKKFKGRHSDTESNCSNVSEDIKNIAKAVTARFSSERSATNMSSDDDFLLTQTFLSPKKTTKSKLRSKKRKKKHQVSLDGSDTSQDSYVTAQTSEPSIDSSSKKKHSLKKVNPHAEDFANSGSLLASNVKQLQELQNDRLPTGAELSDKLKSPTEKSPKKLEKHKSSLHMSSSDSTVAETSRLSMQSPAKKVRFTEEGEELLNAVTKSGSKTKSKKAASEVSEKGHNDSLEISSDDVSSLGDRGKYEYKTPQNFELMDVKHYFKKSELQGKKLFLIQAPKQFDITTLKNQKISLSGTSIVTASKSEGQQYEVTARQYDTQKGSGIYSMVVDNNSLTVGESIQGHLQITDWYPGIPPFVLEKSLPRKHRVEGIDDDVNTAGSAGKKIKQEVMDTGSAGKKIKQEVMDTGSAGKKIKQEVMDTDDFVSKKKQKKKKKKQTKT